MVLTHDYTALQQRMGPEVVDDFVRFYVLPGVYHCGGGDGPTITNLLPSLMLWVERGIAPGALTGAHTPQSGRMAGQGAQTSEPAAAPDLTRPIYPYPQIAQYTGSGSITDAANYVPGPVRAAPAAWSEWLGAAFF